MTHGLNLQIAAEAGTTGPKWLDAFLPSNVSIDITLNSQIWNAKAGSFSETIALPIEENLHILGNLASMRGCDVYKLLYGRRFRLYAEGVLFFYGVIHLDQEVSIKDNTIEIELASSTLEWEDLIADLDCRDVPLKDRIKLGYVINDEEEVEVNVDYTIIIVSYAGGQGGTRKWKRNDKPLQKLKLPSFLIPTNTVTNSPYPDAKFCNINICWQKEDSEGNKLREYEVRSYNRYNTSPCFYAMYFLDCLFNHLKISVLQNDFLGVHDMKRLAFVNTGCFYDIDKASPSLYHLFSGDYIEASSAEDGKDKPFFRWGSAGRYSELYVRDLKAKIIDKVIETFDAYATSKNFPDKDVKTVMSAILDGFGARLIYNSIDQTCSIVLLRNILRQTEYTEIPCAISSVYQKQLHKNGFRVKYSASVEDKEVDMEDFGRDTMYNYTEYKDSVSTLYKNIYQSAKLYDNTCYIDEQTGNAYRVKVDKDAKRKSELYPSWFEVGQFCKVEYGDCSDNEMIEEVSVGFSPVVMNVVSTSNKYERFAYFVDTDSVADVITSSEEVSFDRVCVNTDGEVPGMDAYYEKEWTLQLSVKYKGGVAYNPTQHAQNPLNEIDNGLTLGFCRGNIPISQAAEYDDDGNLINFSEMRNVFHSDSVDSFGNVFDYNDDQSGIDGDDERISLKLRAEKPDVENGGFLPISDPLSQRRGIFSRFYTEYAKWVTERNLVVIEAEVELAWLMNIDMTKKYKIGEFVGFLKSVKYSISNTGLSMVTFELYYL